MLPDTPTLEPSATIVWFPPTATSTPLPTTGVTPTVEMRPGIGDVILDDPFSETTLWTTGTNNTGSIAYGNNELSLAVSQAKGSLVSLRNAPVLSNFSLEITANPSLCRDADVYGLLLRYVDQKNYYRFMVACNGQLRLERVQNSKVVILQDWTASGQVPPGSPLVIRLAVWAVNNEFRFFINDYYQFTARDQVFPSGKLGLFARSAGDTPLTVNFSNLVVNEVKTETLNATPSITPPPGMG
jgi:hypothetical protein